MADDVDITIMLNRVREGDGSASDRLFQLLYDELHSIAGRLFRSQPAQHTLQPTALVHEAYLKLARPGSDVEWQDRAHFFHLGARAMRQILVNHARDRGALKRGGNARREPISVVADRVAEAERAFDLVSLDDELDQLAHLDERQAQIVELKVFGGLTTREMAEVLGVSVRTVELDWAMARAWLGERLRPEAEGRRGE